MTEQSKRDDEGSDRDPSCKPTPGLYLVATPIGNTGDITLRALEVLKGADLIACEDTRVTAKLLTRFGVRAQTLPYHEYNAATMRPKLLERLRGGQVVALVSDAGTPLISDPGYKLVQAVVEAGLAVTALPGASALLTALQLSALPSDRFLFLGFLPSKAAARRTAIDEVAGVRASLVCYESAQRLAALLADLVAVLGPRPAAVARELTKLFEEVRRGTLADLAAHYAAAGPPKGEVVVVIGPPADSETGGFDGAAVESALRHALATSSLRDAVAEVSRLSGQPRKEVYARALALVGAREELLVGAREELLVGAREELPGDGEAER
ncbi:MAG: 16S rRNA (cytidine(1402)-2'-O)-methyltransferase [Rhodospirillaceae bacterium]